MIPPILCNVPPSPELLGPTTFLVFQPGPTTPSFQTRLTHLFITEIKYALMTYRFSDRALE